MCIACIMCVLLVLCVLELCVSNMCTMHILAVCENLMSGYIMVVHINLLCFILSVVYLLGWAENGNSVLD